MSAGKRPRGKLSLAEAEVREVVAPPPAPEPEPEPEMICGTCMAWRQTGRTVGECRRTAPQVAANGSRVWPDTDDNDWCLQWLPLEERR
jgi:hypothetical protein